MISLKKSAQGFTIIELLIVIVVIIILALLVIVTYSGIQAKTRNSERSSDIATLQTSLESFFQDNGYYPSLGDMNSASWLHSNMKRLDTQTLVDPSNPSQSKTLVANPTAKSYSYHVTDGSGATCEGADKDTNCAKYVLTATYEGTFNGATTIFKTNFY